MSELEVHPIADLFPMLADAELREKALDLKTRGLLQPIVLDPTFTTHDGDDPDGVDAAARKGHARTREECLMARNWRCLIGRHDWREVETPDRDKYAECTRCGKHDWRRLVVDKSGKWHGEPPAGLG